MWQFTMSGNFFLWYVDVEKKSWGVGNKFPAVWGLEISE